MRLAAGPWSGRPAKILDPAAFPFSQAPLLRAGPLKGARLMLGPAATAFGPSTHDLQEKLKSPLHLS